MSLKQAVETRPTDPRRRCGVHDWILTLPADELEAAETLLTDTSWTVAYVTKAFNDEGFPLGANTVTRHRKGMCSCR